MKTAASNFVIGVSALAVIAIAFAGLLGYRRIHGVQSRGPLRIVFEGGSASGLVKGGAVNFDGVQVGEITSLKLQSPRRIVAMVRLDNSAPVRKDTAVGLEFQGLTGIAAIALTGGAPAAAAVPLDEDGVPTLTADLTDTQSIRDTLHNVDRVLVDNREALKDALLGFDTYTASLAGKGDEIDNLLRRADGAFDSFERGIGRIDAIVPGLADGRDGVLFQKLQSIRELAESLRKRSAVFMEDGRRTLLDISNGANQFDRKFEPEGAIRAAPPPPPPRANRTARPRAASPAASR
jgi:phospholipid/cholesterol/gamma-HCH transport system substrate-binding protein